MKSRIDVMVDLETLGVKANCNIIQIAAVAFDIKTGGVLDTLNVCSKVDQDVPVEHDTLTWWLSSEDRVKIFNDILDKGAEQCEAIAKFCTYIAGLKVEFHSVCLWGNGILFDNAKLQMACERYGFEYPVHYKCDRDMRTIMDLAAAKTGMKSHDLEDMFPTDVSKEHDALYDCKYQIAKVSWAYNILTNDYRGE